MKNDPIPGTYSEFIVSITVKSNSNQLKSIKHNTGQKLVLVLKNEKVELFGQTIIFKEKIIHCYNVVIADKEKTLKKFEVADDQDILNVKYSPLDKNNSKADIYYKFK